MERSSVPPQPVTQALGAILLATAVVMLETRFEEPWGPGVHLAVAGAAFLLLFVLGTQERHADGPPVQQSIVLISALAMLVAAVTRLGDSVADDLDNPLTIAWMAQLFAAVAAFTAFRYGSAVCTLFAAIGVGVAVMAVVAEVNDNLDFEDFRVWPSIMAGAFGAGAVALRSIGLPRHSVQLVNAAGLALLVVALSFVLEGFFSGFNGGDVEGPGFPTDSGWEFVLLIGSFWILGYGALRREPGPGWLGAIALTLGAGVAAAPKDPDDATIVGWPLAMVVLAGAVLALGVRDRAVGPPATPPSGPPPGAPGGPPPAGPPAGP
jgi:hypothetical protein